MSWYQQIVEFRAGNKSFYYTFWLAVWIGWFSVAGLLGRSPKESIVLAIFGSLITGYISIASLSKQWRDLTNRIDNSYSLPFSVYVNDVLVGEISDADHARIVRSVLFDPVIMVRQIWRFVVDVLRFFGAMFFVIPFCLFWIAFSIWVYSPAELSNTIDNLNGLSYADLLPTLNTILLQYTFLYFLYKMLKAAWDGGFQFHDVSQALSDSVRQEVGCSAVGKIELYRLIISSQSRGTVIDLHGDGDGG